MPQGNPRPGELYLHFKQKLYQVVTVAEQTETGERLVVYQALYGAFRTYARPYDSFVGPVDRKKYPDARQRYRFQLVERKGAGNPPAEPGKEVAPPEGTPPEAWRGKEPESAPPEAWRGKGPESAPPEAWRGKGPESAPPEAGRGKEPESAPPEAWRGKVSGGALEAAGRRKAPEAGRGKAPEGTPLEAWRGKKPESALPGAGASEEELNRFREEKMMEFLDAETMEEKYKILLEMEGCITDRMINNLAVALDVVVKEGPLDLRYEELKVCIRTFQRYEISRLR